MPINVTYCFLCAFLQRPLLAAVPINVSSSIKASPALQNFSCTPPLPSVPLWEPDFTPGPLPTYTCYVQSLVPRSNFSLSCHTNLTIAEQLASPLGLYFWCHNTLHSCITHATPGPYTLVVIVPQLTLYGEAEFSLLFGAQPKHAAFLPIMVGISLMTSVVAAGFLGGALGHSFITADNPRVHLGLTGFPSTSAYFSSPGGPTKSQGPRPLNS
jgi:hypothetical protein